MSYIYSHEIHKSSWLSSLYGLSRVNLFLVSLWNYYLKNIILQSLLVYDKLNVDTIYLDLAKAFDKVPHQRLLLKLKAHGIDGLVCT